VQCKSIRRREIECEDSDCNSVCRYGGHMRNYQTKCTDCICNEPTFPVKLTVPRITTDTPVTDDDLDDVFTLPERGSQQHTESDLTDTTEQDIVPLTVIYTKAPPTKPSTKITRIEAPFIPNKTPTAPNQPLDPFYKQVTLNPIILNPLATKYVLNIYGFNPLQYKYPVGPFFG
jgi:hypothetical protein